jgi:Autographiviridae endonuclease VII
MYKKGVNDPYVRFDRDGVSVTPPTYRAPMKKCTKCNQIRPETDFYAANGTRDGLRGECKTCFAVRAKVWYASNRERAIKNASAWRRANLERARATRRARYSQTRDRARDQHLRRTFGMTQEDYERMLEAQAGVCAICLQPPKPGEVLHVDHHDDRGGVRGLLCVCCNNALGQLREDVGVAQRALDYLMSNGFVRNGQYVLDASARERARLLVRSPG